MGRKVPASDTFPAWTFLAEYSLRSTGMSHNFTTVDEYLATLRAMGRRPATLAHYEYVLNHLTSWRGQDITDLTRLEARSYLRTLTDTYAPGGVASRLKALRSFYSWCVREELATENPFRGLTVKVPDEAQPTATEEQIDAMLQSAKRNKRDLALLTVLADTGCRKGEIAAVEFRDLDLTTGTITFRESKTKPRTVPLTDRAVIALARYLRGRGTSSGSLWSVGDPYSLVKAAVKRHSTLTPHTLRRAFAVRWLANGGSETSLMRICGWSSITMIQTYVKASQDSIAHDEFRRMMA